MPTAKKVWGSSSARSWIACGEGLKYSAMLEMPYGQGVIISTQMQIGSKLAAEPAAQVLLANAIYYCDRYKSKVTNIIVFAPGKPEIAEFLKTSGCDVQEADDLAKVIADPSTLVVHASKANIESLLSLKDQVTKFANSGGWIMLWGLESDGLQSYNKLLGTEHLLREFRLERVSIEPDILTAGLGNRDVVQNSDEEIMHGDKWLSQEVFTYCVDGADIVAVLRTPRTER